MSLSLLAPELVLQILQYVEPRDLISLRACSTGLFEIIAQHEHSICRAIALSGGLRNGLQIPRNVLLTLDTRPLQELRVIVRLWNRRCLIEQLVPVVASRKETEIQCPQIARRGLELLWDYHNALRIESEDLEVETYRSFVRSVTRQEINSLKLTAEACGEALLNTLGYKNPRPVRGGYGFIGVCAYSNLVLIRGLDFLVKAVVEKSPGALDDVKNWKSPTTRPPMLRLLAELRWKEKLALMGLSDTGSGA